MEYIPFAFPGLAHINVAFYTRRFGDISLDKDLFTSPAREEIIRNRNRLCQDHHLAGFAECIQVHGTDIVFEPGIQPPHCAPMRQPNMADMPNMPNMPDTPENSPAPEADGMALCLENTACPGLPQKPLALLIKTADCQPVLLAHKGGKHIAALHIGWKGNRKDFAGIAIQEICAHYKQRPHEWIAVRGPSLGPEAAEFINFKSEWPEAFRNWFTPSTQCMDLWSLTRDQLIHAGLLARNIFSLDLCTAQLSSLFFSYRLEKQCGRQASLIWASA